MGFFVGQRCWARSDIVSTVDRDGQEIRKHILHQQPKDRRLNRVDKILVLRGLRESLVCNPLRL